MESPSVLLGRIEFKPVEKKDGDQQQPLQKMQAVTSKPGVNFGAPDSALYEVAREEVVQRNAATRDYTIELRNQRKRNPDYHYIHGKVYDLRGFSEKHPGGADILRMTAGLVDSTPLFESYHAMANLPNISAQLANYEVKDEEGVPSLYQWEASGFYNTVRSRVRAHFGGSEAGRESLTKQSKANWKMGLKVGVQFSLNAMFYYLAIVRHDLPTPMAMVCAFLAGMFMIQWGFTCMHDASHFALGPRNHWLNQAVTRVWCSWSLWSGRVWMLHHAVWHHAFTGAEELDPDIHHFLPLVRKHPDTDTTKEFKLVRLLGEKFGMVGWGVAAIMLYVFTPGMWMGQVLMYFDYRVTKIEQKQLWGMPEYAKMQGYEFKAFEHLLYAAQIGFHVWRGNLWVTAAYIVANNLFYAMCIVADHDLVESAITNHIDLDGPTDETGKFGVIVADWGEVQVRNSTDFINDELNLFAALHGSINFQIEHHLFPGISHIHLPHIAPIVQKACEEFGIPYTTYPRIQDAWYSFLLVMRAVMTGKDVEQHHLDNLKTE